jgi:glycosyltransferase involved in cell wall biosynthesis
MTKPAISVVIPTYNYAGYLRESIDSALNQTCEPIEVIVVDDGSVDETPEVLASYGNRIRTFRQENRGVAAARNFGASQARGDYLAFLDADDVWLPRKLELQMARFERDPDVGLVHCAVEMVDDTGRIIDPFARGLEGNVAAELLRFRQVIPGPGCAVVIPKRVFDEVGGFDERLAPAEDWDLCYRIAVRHRIGYVDEVLLRYRLHDRGLHLNVARLDHGMLLALEKAFATADPELQGLRHYSYGRAHLILAGCYFRARNPAGFFRHALRSLRYDPRNVGHFAMYPWRVLSRMWRRSQSR